MFTAYNMQAADNEQFFPGIAEAALANTAQQAYKQGYQAMVQEAEPVIQESLAALTAAESTARNLAANLDATKAALVDSEQARMLAEGALAAEQTVGGRLSGLKNLAGEQLSAFSTAAGTRLAPYWAKAEPYWQKVAGPTNAVVGALAQAATSTGGAITGGAGWGIEKLTTKTGVANWLNNPETIRFLSDKYPTVLSSLEHLKSNRQTYDMILGGVALAVGTYLTGKVLSAGYNRLYNRFAAEPDLAINRVAEAQPGYFALQPGETLQNQIERLIDLENNLKSIKNSLRADSKNPLLSVIEKDKLINEIQKTDTQLALLTNKINQLSQKQQRIEGGAWRTSGSLEQQIAQTIAARDKAESQVYKLLLEGKKDAADYAKKIAADLNMQLTDLQAQLPAQPAAQQAAQQPGFFSRAYAKLPGFGLPSWFRRSAPTKLAQLEAARDTAQAEVTRLRSEGSFQAANHAEQLVNGYKREIEKLKAQSAQMMPAAPLVTTPEAPAQTTGGWRSYLPSRPSMPTFGGVRSYFFRNPSPTISGQTSGE